ncbi:hypothetical protein [Azospirillum canadense]|uniref:hypothetical protein n=1 Tax=Azospirillum canadense TaxID=403962 RepID=UPI00222739B6|nr:hypothetical protein [Azospirillum canadense]MCW2239068.1 hypothetical protein [Azospirillum canadense]
MATIERTPRAGGVADAASIASPVAQKPASGVRPLTMVEAKQGLAAMYGVDVAQIEITIRG